jgi:hypothetical protein
MNIGERPPVTYGQAKGGDSLERPDNDICEEALSHEHHRTNRQCRGHREALHPAPSAPDYPARVGPGPLEAGGDHHFDVKFHSIGRKPCHRYSECGAAA